MDQCHPAFYTAPMARPNRQQILTAALKALLAAVETNALVKGATTFVAELSTAAKSLPPEQRNTLADATADELRDALVQLDIVLHNAAYAAVGVDRILESLTDVQRHLASELREMRTELQKLRELTVKLQEAQAHEQQRAAMLTRSVEGVRMLAETTHRYAPSPELQRIVDKLQQALTEYDARFGQVALSEEDTLDLRLAQATVENAHRCFDKALELVTDADVKAEEAALTDQLERVITVHRVRADAFFGKADWEKAPSHYQRIRVLRPEDLNAVTGTGICLAQLGRLPDAFEYFDAAVELFTRLVEQEGRSELANDLAMSLNNRGNALKDQGKLVEAMADYNKAVEIHTRLVEQEGRSDLANELAASLNNRGNALKDQGKLAEAMADYNKAVEIHTRLVEQEGRSDLANDLAGSLNNRSNALKDQGKFADAFADCDKAVAIYTRLVEKEDRSELANDLAGSLNNRGTALSGLGKLAEAMADFDKAVAIRTRLVEQEGRSELANDLAVSYFNRAITLMFLARLENALADAEKAVTIFSVLVHNKGRAELSPRLENAEKLRAMIRKAIEDRDQGTSDAE